MTKQIPVEDMNWEVQFDRKFRTHGYYLFSRNDEFCNADSARAIKDFIREAITTAVKEEKERTRQVVRQAQIAMEYIEDDEQADWCLARFDAMLDEDFKLQQPK